MSSVVPVVHVGLGPIGSQIVLALAGRSRYQSVGAVDIAPELIGRSLAGVAGGGTSEVAVVGSLDALPLGEGEAVAIHCAGSSLERVAPTLCELMAQGYHVVSTCEELSNPWATHPDIARDLDAAAQAAGVSLLGTGVNPGYAMDYLPIVLAGSQHAVTSVMAHRVQDASLRRVPLQKKVGVGLEVSEFNERVSAGAIRHVGLPESARLVDRALSLGCDSFIETIDPIIATAPVQVADAVVPEGRVLGIDQLVVGKKGSTPVVRLHLQMAAGLADPRDEVSLAGDPGVELVVRGLHGDSATAAVVINSLERVANARPGLRTVDEVPASPMNLAG